MTNSLIHTCTRCKKDTTTFFAHRIPVPDTDEYRIDPEYICSSCIMERLHAMMRNAMSEAGGTLSWFAEHRRISLEYEDEQWGSFTVSLWHAERLSFDHNGPAIPYIMDHPLQFVVQAENLTYTESIVFSFECSEERTVDNDFIIAIKSALGALYSSLKSKRH